MNTQKNSDIEDCNWWRHIGKLIGATLHGWSYRYSASFVDPHIEMTGKVANVLLNQEAKIKQLQDDLNNLRECL